MLIFVMVKRCVFCEEGKYFDFFWVETQNLKDYRHATVMTCNPKLVTNLDLIEFNKISVPRRTVERVKMEKEKKKKT